MSLQVNELTACHDLKKKILSCSMPFEHLASDFQKCCSEKIPAVELIHPPSQNQSFDAIQYHPFTTI